MVDKSLVTDREIAIINVVMQTCGVNKLSLKKMQDRMALGKAISIVAAHQFKTPFSA